MIGCLPTTSSMCAVCFHRITNSIVLLVCGSISQQQVPHSHLSSGRLRKVVRATKEKAKMPRAIRTLLRQEWATRREVVPKINQRHRLILIQGGSTIHNSGLQQT